MPRTVAVNDCAKVRLLHRTTSARLVRGSVTDARGVDDIASSDRRRGQDAIRLLE